MEHLPAADGSANAIRQTRCLPKELNRGPREAQELWAGSTQRPEKHREISSHQRIQEPYLSLCGEEAAHTRPEPKGHTFECVPMCVCKMQNTHPSGDSAHHASGRQDYETEAVCLPGCWPRVCSAPLPSQSATPTVKQ